MKQKGKLADKQRKIMAKVHASLPSIFGFFKMLHSVRVRWPVILKKECKNNTQFKIKNLRKNQSIHLSIFLYVSFFVSNMKIFECHLTIIINKTCKK